MPKIVPLSVLQAAVDLMVKHNGKRSEAAREGKINPSTLFSRIEQARVKGIGPSAKVEKDVEKDVNALKYRLKKAESEIKAHESSLVINDQILGIIGSLAKKASDITPPEWVISPNIKASSPGAPTLFLSDWHWGEMVSPSQINGVNKYSMAIAKQRLHEAGDRAIKLLKIISPKMDYPGLVMPLGGDMVSGNIHDELTATNEMNSMPVLLDIFGELVALITRMADVFGKVFLPCVSGNHGRNTTKIWNKDRHATSFDWLLYQLLAKRFEGDDRVTFLIPEGPDAFYKIYNYKYLLTHGDQFRGGDSMIGCLGPIIRGDHKKRSRNGQIDMEYDMMIMGHWHQYIHHSRVIVNGSGIGYNEYAYNNNFGFEEPQQALWITHPEHDITFRMPINLARQKKQISTKWVSIKSNV